MATLPHGLRAGQLPLAAKGELVTGVAPDHAAEARDEAARAERLRRRSSVVAASEPTPGHRDPNAALRELDAVAGHKPMKKVRKRKKSAKVASGGSGDAGGADRRATGEKKRRRRRRFPSLGVAKLGAKLGSLLAARFRRRPKHGRYQLPPPDDRDSEGRLNRAEQEALARIGGRRRSSFAQDRMGPAGPISQRTRRMEREAQDAAEADAAAAAAVAVLQSQDAAGGGGRRRRSLTDLDVLKEARKARRQSMSASSEAPLKPQIAQMRARRLSVSMLEQSLEKRKQSQSERRKSVQALQEATEDVLDAHRAERRANRRRSSAAGSVAGAAAAASAVQAAAEGKRVGRRRSSTSRVSFSGVPEGGGDKPRPERRRRRSSSASPAPAPAPAPAAPAAPTAKQNAMAGLLAAAKKMKAEQEAAAAAAGGLNEQLGAVKRNAKARGLDTSAVPAMLDVVNRELEAKNPHLFERIRQRRVAKAVNRAATKLKKLASKNLHKAAANGLLEQVAVAIREGHDVNKRDADGRTPLFMASQNGHEDCVRLLLENGANAHLADVHGKETPLHAAASHGHNLVCAHLIRSGHADVNAEMVHGATPLINACLRDDLETAETLVAFNARIEHLDSQGMGALHYAAWRCQVGMVTMLLKYGADVTFKDNQEWSASQWAAFSRRPQLAQRLALRTINPKKEEMLRQKEQRRARRMSEDALNGRMAQVARAVSESYGQSSEFGAAYGLRDHQVDQYDWMELEAALPSVSAAGESAGGATAVGRLPTLN